MKKILYRLIDFYLAPLGWNESLSLFGKHRMMKDNEHLIAAVHMIHKKFPQPEGTVIDVGAYVGRKSVFFARHFPSSKVIAFEPNPETFPSALNNTKDFPSIKLQQFALDKKNGELDFYVSNQNLSSSLNPFTENPQFHLNKKIKVQVKKLDDCIPENEKVLLIKLDTQGRELNILAGAESTLKNTRYVLSEMVCHHYYSGGCMYYEVDQFLRDHQFKLVNITAGYNYAGLMEYDALYENTKKF